MIRDKAFFCKLFSQEDHPADRLADFMKSFDPARETCPCCHSRGFCRPHAHYARYLIGLSNGKPECRRVTILRVFCTSCRHTHAILPDFIIPFRQFSLHFILKVLVDYFTHRSPSRMLGKRVPRLPAERFPGDAKGREPAGGEDLEIRQ